MWAIEVFGEPLPNSADTFLMMGYCKAAITFVKYLPQVYLNWKRQSCQGFSFENVVLDFMGGFLSFSQSALKSIALGDPFFDAGAFNLVKFILSITSMFFDTIFFIQFAIYKGNKPKGEQPTLEDLDAKTRPGRGLLDNNSDAAIGKSHANSDVKDQSY